MKMTFLHTLLSCNSFGGYLNRTSCDRLTEHLKIRINGKWIDGLFGQTWPHKVFLTSFWSKYETSLLITTEQSVKIRYNK